MKTTTENKKNNQKILVVDDDIGILDAIDLILDDEGYIVETTPNGDEIFERTNKFNPNLIILDVLLSGSDGRAICQMLKTETKTKNIPIIMISAHPNIDKSVKEAGADAFLPKPFDTKELLDTISKVLR